MSDKIHLIYSYLANKISFEGARALAESLKQNTIITELNISGISDMNV